MNRNELIVALRSHLADKESIDSEAAPALALMRYSLLELQKTTSDAGTNGETEQLREQLDGMNAAAGRLHAQLSDREAFIYEILADLGMVPEADDEPVDSLTEAIELMPDLLSNLLLRVASLNVGVSNVETERFIDGVRRLLDAPDDSLEDLYLKLESKAQYLAQLEVGITNRDSKLANAEEILSACLSAAKQDWQDIDDLPATISRYVTKAVLHDSMVRITPDVDIHAQDTGGRIVTRQVTQTWLDDAVDLAHAVAGDLAPENRVMAKAARHLIQTVSREA